MKHFLLILLTWNAMALSVSAADPPPDSVALVVNGMDQLNPWEKLSFTCLQGLANRERPSIYLILDGKNDRLWLDWYIEEYGLETQELDNPYQLFEYRWPINGYCLVDTDAKHTGNLAANYASSDGLLPVTDRMLSEYPQLLDLDVKRDLRELPDKQSATSAYEWAYENQWRSLAFNRSVTGVTMAPDRRLSPFWQKQYIRDYVVAQRGFMFELSADPNHSEEYALRDRYLAEMDDWGYLMGWHVDRDKEPQHVAHATEHHQLVLCSNTSPNFSFHQHIKPAEPRYVQQHLVRQSDSVRLDPNKVYLTYYFSDGDSLNWLCRGAHGRRWLEGGEIPMGWEIQPLLVELAPGMLDYFYRTATDKDVLIASASGIGYNHPERLSPDRLREYLAISKPYFQQLDLNALLVLTAPESRRRGVPRATVDIYHELLGETLLGVFESYTAVERDPIRYDGFVWMPTRLPHSSIPQRKPAGAYADLSQMIDSRTDRPLFISFHVNKGHMSYRQSVEMTNQLKLQFGDRIQVVTPDRFLRLQQTQETGTDAGVPLP